MARALTEPSASLRLAEEAMGLARERGAPAQATRSEATRGLTLYLLGRHDLARPLLEQAASGPGAYEGSAGDFFAGAVAQSFLTRLLAVLGLLDRSARLATEAIERVRETGHLPSLASTLVGCCSHAWLVRDAETLRSRARALADLADAQGYPHFSTRARDMMGWVAVEEGRVAEGIGLVEDSLASLRRAGNVLHTSQMEAMLADAYLAAGDADAALAHVEEALRTAARTGEAWLMADLHRRLGTAMFRRIGGDAARAEAEFRRALEIARSQSARLFELRAARDLARLLRDRGRVAEARDVLAPVYTAFTEGFGFPDLVEARALLDELRPSGRRIEDRAR